MPTAPEAAPPPAARAAVKAGSACAMLSCTAMGTVSAPLASGFRLTRSLRRARKSSDSTEATDMPSAAPTSV